MSSAVTVKDLGKLERFVFRPAFVLLTFVVVLLALVQLAGRIAVYVLPHFADELNAVLAGQQVVVHGLDGDWRGLNPVVRVAQLDFPAGRVTDAELELDLLESALRSAWVPRLVRVGEARVHLQQTDAGWALKNMPPAGERPDLSDALRQGDELSASAHLILHPREGEPEEVRLSVRMVNRGGRHFAEAEVPGVNTDTFLLRVWQQDAVPFWTEAFNQMQARGELALPAALSGMPELRLSELNGWWLDVSGQGGGTLDARVDGLRAPDVKRSFSLELNAEGERNGPLVSAVLARLAVVADEDVLDLSGLRVGVHWPEEPALTDEVLFDPPPPPGPLLRVWRERLDLAEVTGFVVRHLRKWEPLGRWVKALDLTGEVHNLHAFVDPETGWGYAGSMAGVHMQGYKGAPTVLGGQGQLWGYAHGVAAQVNARDMGLQFPDLFNDLWQLDDVQGVVKGWFGPGYFAMRGSHIKARTGQTSVAGEFSLSRPDPRYEQRVGLTLAVDKVGLKEGKTFIPYKIPEELADWLARGPQGGTLSDVRFAYHGQVHTRDGELGRRIELAAAVEDGAVQYDPAWPEVTGFSGRVHAAGVQTRVYVDSAWTAGARISSGTVVLHDNGRYAEVAMDGRLDADDGLAFVLATPLRQDMSFVTPEWRAEGDLTLRADLTVPINAELAPPLRADLSFNLDGITLDMPEYRTLLTDLTGRGRFSLPHRLSGEFDAQLFERPAHIKATHEDDWVRFAIQGGATPADVYRMINYRDVGVAEGELAFDSVLSIAVGSNMVTNLAVTSDLTGLELVLPAHLAKPAEVSVPMELDVQFLADYQSVRWNYKDTIGWIHFGDDVERGAIGINTDPPMTAQDQRAILIGGALEQVTLADWVSDDGDAKVALPLDWVIRDFRVNRFVIDELVFEDVLLSGAQTGNDAHFDFASPDLEGRVELPGQGRMQILLEHVRLPGDAPVELDLAQAPEGAREDPLSVEVGRSLPAAHVEVKQLFLGNAPFGAWKFDIHPLEQEVIFEPFAVDVNGVHIKDGRMQWNLLDNTSAFEGDVVLDDLAETLPQWDYAPSLQTKSASIHSDASWAGSPANVSLLGLQGELVFGARDGRFLEVESEGGLKMMSLLNFSNIAKRISFDFTDVTEDGISFEKIKARVRMDKGHLQFVEPMIVDSSSSNFQVGGSVDLHSGILDNEMIVTLPVSNSLPWYGVYLALANPLAGLGVLVGERVFRNQISAFSSAKFEVKGTLDEPKVSFVSLWDQSLTEPKPPAAAPVEPVGKTEAEVGAHDLSLLE